ncbi:MAG: addiction module protein [Candidatus Marinimicrobia bacterium]|nr:addiction module protein [Candidatus Neomarinimicrobiota bacterium]
MINTENIVSETLALPIDIRTLLVSELLESLNKTDKEIDKMWAEEAEKRVKEITSGEVKTIPGEKVFEEINNKFGL